MADIESNRKNWDIDYDWPQGGDEWSVTSGGVDMQWYMTILPRIHAFLPAGSILEIGPGFGRWTQYLREHCRALTLVDLSGKCIAACRRRFLRDSRITYHVNDGKSLAMVPDHSVDFVFSFDSLVHAEEDVIAAYLCGLAKKLKKDGAGFIHHSNIGAYREHEFQSDHSRAFSVTAEKFGRLAQEAGLRCVSQEIINWGTPDLFTDCFSIIARPDTAAFLGPRRVENPEFPREVAYAAYLGELYGEKNFKKPAVLQTLSNAVKWFFRRS